MEIIYNFSIDYYELIFFKESLLPMSPAYPLPIVKGIRRSVTSLDRSALTFIRNNHDIV